MLGFVATPVLEKAYRGDGTDRPRTVPLPPEPMPMLHAFRMRKRWRYVSIWSEAISICAGRVEVGPFRQEFWAIWDRRRGVLHERTRLRTGNVHLAPGRVRVHDGDVDIVLALDEGPGVEVVTPDDDRCAHRPRPDQLVERQAGPVPFAMAQPADPGRQALERHARLGHPDPALERRVLRKELEDGLVRPRMSAGSPDRAAQRKGPRPSQNCGRM